MIKYNIPGTNQKTVIICICCPNMLSICFAMVFAPPVRLCLQAKLSSSLTMGNTGKYQPVVKNFRANKSAALVVRTF